LDRKTPRRRPAPPPIIKATARITAKCFLLLGVAGSSLPFGFLLFAESMPAVRHRCAEAGSAATKERWTSPEQVLQRESVDAAQRRKRLSRCGSGGVRNTTRTGESSCGGVCNRQSLLTLRSVCSSARGFEAGDRPPPVPFGKGDCRGVFGRSSSSVGSEVRTRHRRRPISGLRSRFSGLPPPAPHIGSASPRPKSWLTLAGPRPLHSRTDSPSGPGARF